ncbi:MAG: hypothetical protein KF838_00445 [Phycisphaeraceae bacterium]|nr:MAG: hypothetical protein KF838_00445 [Phycisphaeraceae bacterium]
MNARIKAEPSGASEGLPLLLSAGPGQGKAGRSTVVDKNGPPKSILELAMRGVLPPGFSWA